jgi:hypothetical protein
MARATGGCDVFGMSALGHKRTFAVHQPMSALPPIATSITVRSFSRLLLLPPAPPWDREALLSLVRDKLFNLIQPQRSLAASAGDSCQQAMMRRRTAPSY